MSRPYRILLVNKTALLLTLFQRIVITIYPSTHVIQALNGHEALAAWSLDGADLLITDCSMPIMDGFTLVQILRAQQVTIPIVMVSSNGSNAPAALAAGATHFFTLPYELNDLRTLLPTLLPP